MKTDSHEMLHERDFGSALLDTERLLQWLAKKSLRLPVAIESDFVQIELLLSRIQGATERGVSRAEALEVVMANPELCNHEMRNLSPQWLLGGEAYIQWAALIKAGIEQGDLQALDFASKLPIKPAYSGGVGNGSQPSDVVASPAPVSRTSSQDAQILKAIKDLGYEATKLPRNPPGKRGIKADVRELLGNKGMWAGTTVFDKGWARLSKDGSITLLD